MNFLTKFTIILILLVCQACDQSDCRRSDPRDGKSWNTRDCSKEKVRCIEADDWGYPKIWIPAETSDIIKSFQTATGLDESETTADTSLKGRSSTYGAASDRLQALSFRSQGIVSGAYPNQSTLPIRTNQILLGADRNLVISVSNFDSWSSWFGGVANFDEDGQRDMYGYDNGQEIPPRECRYQVTNSSAAINPNTSVFTDNLSPAVVYQGDFTPVDQNAGARQTILFYIDDTLRYQSLEVVDETVASSKQDNENLRNDSGGIEGFTSVKLESNELVPCNIRFGFGLYVGFAPTAGAASISHVGHRSVTQTFHIPDARRPGSIDNFINTDATKEISHTHDFRLQNNINRGMDGFLVLGTPENEFGTAVDGSSRLFFKIVDRYYNDNSGGYLVRIKEGTRNFNLGPIETIMNFFESTTITVLQTVYEGIVKDNNYYNLVRAFLILCIVFFGYRLIIGGSDLDTKANYKEAIFLILKVALIFKVLGPDSWNFFYNHFFAIFLGGVQDISSLLISPFKDYDPNSPWYSMDKLLERFFSPEVAAKVTSVLISHFLGWGMLFFIVLYTSIIIFVVAIFFAIVTAIVAFLTIAILLSLGPIFVIFILFEKTKSLFDEWIGHLFSYSMQYLLLMTGIGMFAAIIVMYMERTLGFRVCWNEFFNLEVIEPLHSFRTWMPDISSAKAMIWLDLDNNGIRGIEPREEAYRYRDLPYLDTIHDRRIIEQYLTEREFIEIDSVLILFLSVFVMYSFLKFVPVLSQTLKGGSRSDTGNLSLSIGTALGEASGIMKAGARGLYGLRKQPQNIRKLNDGYQWRKANRKVDRGLSKLNRKDAIEKLAVSSSFNNVAAGVAGNAAGNGGVNDTTGKSDVSLDNRILNANPNYYSFDEARLNESLKQDLDDQVNSLSSLKTQYGENSYYGKKLDSIDKYQEVIMITESTAGNRKLSSADINKVNEYVANSDNLKLLNDDALERLELNVNKAARGNSNLSGTSKTLTNQVRSDGEMIENFALYNLSAADISHEIMAQRVSINSIKQERKQYQTALKTAKRQGTSKQDVEKLTKQLKLAELRLEGAQVQERLFRSAAIYKQGNKRFIREDMAKSAAKMKSIQKKKRDLLMDTGFNAGYLDKRSYQQTRVNRSAGPSSWPASAGSQAGGSSGGPGGGPAGDSSAAWSASGGTSGGTSGGPSGGTSGGSSGGPAASPTRQQQTQDRSSRTYKDEGDKKYQDINKTARDPSTGDGDKQKEFNETVLQNESEVREKESQMSNDVQDVQEAFKEELQKTNDEITLGSEAAEQARVSKQDELLELMKQDLATNEAQLLQDTEQDGAVKDSQLLQTTEQKRAIKEAQLTEDMDESKLAALSQEVETQQAPIDPAIDSKVAVVAASLAPKDNKNTKEPLIKKAEKMTPENRIKAAKEAAVKGVKLPTATKALGSKVPKGGKVTGSMKGKVNKPTGEDSVTSKKALAVKQPTSKLPSARKNDAPLGKVQRDGAGKDYEASLRMISDKEHQKLQKSLDDKKKKPSEENSFFLKEDAVTKGAIENQKTADPELAIDRTVDLDRNPDSDDKLEKANKEIGLLIKQGKTALLKGSLVEVRSKMDKIQDKIRKGEEKSEPNLKKDLEDLKTQELTILGYLNANESSY